MATWTLCRLVLGSAQMTLLLLRRLPVRVNNSYVRSCQPVGRHGRQAASTEPSKWRGTHLEWDACAAQGSPCTCFVLSPGHLVVQGMPGFCCCAILRSSLLEMKSCFMQAMPVKLPAHSMLHSRPASKQAVSKYWAWSALQCCSGYPEIHEQHASPSGGASRQSLSQFQAMQSTWQHAPTSCKHCHWKQPLSVWRGRS